MSEAKSASGHKGTIIFVAGGLLILLAAGWTLYSQEEKKSEEKAAAEPAKKPSTVFKPPAPLIVEEKPEPVVQTDTEQPKEVKSAPAVARKTTGQRKRLNLGDPISDGTMDPKELARFVNSKFASVRTCYERRLKINPALQGIVDLRIAVSPSGKVAGVSVNSDSVGDRQMLECVKTTVRRWRFPKPEGGRIVFDKPFNFKKKV